MSHRTPAFLLLLLALLLLAPLSAAGQTPTPTPPRSADDPAAAVLQAAQAHAAAGDTAAALAGFREAVALYRAAGNADGETAAHFFTALYQRKLGAWADALASYRLALAAAAPLKAPLVAAALRLGEGDCLALLDRPDAALAAYAAADALYGSVDDPTARRGRISALNSRGNLLHRLGRYGEAIAAFEAGLPLAGQLADAQAEMLLRAGLGAAQQARGAAEQQPGDYAAALAAFERVGQLAEGLGDAQWRQTALLGMGSAQASLRRFDAAAESFTAGALLAAERGDGPGEALLRLEAGLALADAGRFAESVDPLTRARDLEQAAHNRPREALVLSHLADAFAGLGRHREALAAYEAARGIAEAVDDPLLLAGILNGVGLLYDVLGRAQAAEDSLHAAQELARAGGWPALTATALNNLGTVFNHRARYAEAQAAYEEALSIFRARASPADIAITLNNLAQNYDSQGRYAAAAPLYEEALAIHQGRGDAIGAATVIENQAGQDAAQGRYAQALARYGEALAAFRSAGRLYEQSVALSNLATLLATLGRYDDARTRYEEALALRRTLGDRAGEGVVTGNLAALDYEAGAYEAALTHYAAAAGIATEMADAGAAATWRNHTGTVLIALERYADAQVAYADALERFRGQGDRAGEAAALNGLGVAALHQGAAAEGGAAEAGAAEAGAQFDAALAIYRELGITDGEATTLANKAALLADAGRDADALALYRQALALREKLRGAAPGDELRVGLTVGAAAVYDAAAALAVRLGRDEEAFALTERARARGLLDQLNAGPIDLAAGADAELLAREQALRAEIRGLEGQAREERIKPSPQRDAGRAQALGQRLQALQATYAALLTEIKAGRPEYAALVSVEPPGLAEVQARLPQDVTIVSYYLGVDAALAFVVQRDRFETVTLPVTTAQVWQEVADFRTSFAALDGAAEAVAARLSDQLIAPVAQFLDTPVVGIIPHGPLHYLPFSALVWAAADRTPAGRPLLLSEQFALFSLPSAGVLAYLPLEAPQGEGAAVVLAHDTVVGLPRLVHAAAEAAAVAAALGVAPLTGDAATERAVRAAAATTRVLHIAAHGQFSAAAPLFSRLLLAPGGGPAGGDPAGSDPAGGDDGSLEVHEIYGLNLHHADLVTLSACQTDVGKLNAGDDVTGLSRAFFYAGAKSVIASLWSVDDEATAALMGHFYGNLARGLGKAQALAAAQAAVRGDAAHPAWAHPYYWAAFVLNGDPGVTVAGSPWWPWVAGGAALVGLGLGAWGIRRRGRAGRGGGHVVSAASQPPPTVDER